MTFISYSHVDEEVASEVKKKSKEDYGIPVESML